MIPAGGLQSPMPSFTARAHRAPSHSFADIARQEGKAERHIRHLAPLAFVSPRIITAIMDSTAPAGLTATALARPGGQSLHVLREVERAVPPTPVAGRAD